jgi:hypothetical protein
MSFLKTFARGLGLSILPLGLGLCIARYVPSRWIGIGSLVLLLFVIYITGALFPTVPWRNPRGR